MRWTARDARGFGIEVAYLLPSLILFTAFMFVPLMNDQIDKYNEAKK